MHGEYIAALHFSLSFQNGQVVRRKLLPSLQSLIKDCLNLVIWDLKLENPKIHNRYHNKAFDPSQAKFCPYGLLGLRRRWAS